MKLKTKLLLIAITLLNMSIYAQDSYQLKGIVSDANNVPIPGANIVIENTTKGTATDFDGIYEIEVKNGDVINVSYIGYVTQKIAIVNQKELNITLIEDAALLDEVVVVGYGTIKKSHLTGAVAKVGGDEIAAVQATRVDDALAGKLPGVLIQNQSGEPGAAPKIQIRAASSVSGNSDPLIVVDGYPISGSLATVNPNDIESMEILKDAASAAIYGSRGANGVILVTTKKGKSGKATFSYNTYTSFSNKYQRDDLNMSSNEFGALIESNIANGKWDVSDVNPDVLNYRINAYKNNPDVVSVEDWLFRTGFSTSHDFNISGGSDDVNYFASVGYLNTDGIAITQDFEKLNARMNVDAKLGDKFKTGLSFNGFKSDRGSLAYDMRDLLRSYNISPIYHTAASIAFVQELDAERQRLSASGVPGLSATFDSGYRGGNAPFNNSIYTLQPGMTAQDWHYGRSGNGLGGTSDAGPATKLDNAKQTETTFFANVSSYLQYNILDGLNIKTVLGGDMLDTHNFYYKGLESDAAARSNETALDVTDLKVTTVLSESTLNYAKDFGKHALGAVAGMEFQTTNLNGIQSNGTNVPASAIVNYNLLLPADIVTTERNETRVRKSLFGRITYAYDDRYLLSASVRRDGDSRFGANKKYATFPAISLGWNVHNESFLKGNSSMSQLKLRFSTGSLGTTSFLGSYDALSLLQPAPTVFGVGFLIPGNVSNPDLTWQTNTETNYGLDLGFINNRFTLSTDYYTSDVQDMLIKQSVSEVLGTSSLVQNSGDVRSSGLELSLTAKLMYTENFNWTIGANFSTVNTEITKLGGGIAELPRFAGGQSGRGPMFRNYVGGGISEMWGIETLGEVEEIYMSDPTRNIGINSSAYYVKDQQSPGEPGYGVIDKTKPVSEGGDLVKIGQNTPDFYWGFNSSMRYKALDMSFQIQGSQGAEVFNIDPIYYKSQFGGRLAMDRFDANNDGLADNNGERYMDTNNQLDATMQDASYIALRNLTIGYTLNQDVTSKIGLSSVRVYAAATNLLYLWASNYTSFNPEGVQTSGSDYFGPTTYGVQNGASPTVRSFAFGLNINF